MMPVPNPMPAAAAPVHRARVGAALPPGAVASVAIASGLLALAVLVLVWRFVEESTRFAGDYTHVDEIFFAVCASRGVAVGDWPPAGCHDNKAPLIYVVYGLVDLLGGRFDLASMKAAAAVLVAASLASVGWAAARAAGLLAGLLSALLAALALGISSEMVALKTELLGTVPVVLGALLLAGAAGVPGTARALLAGLLFGTAVMTKQTFAPAAVAAGLWLLLPPLSGRRPVGARLAAVAGFGGGVLLPFAALAAWFGSRGQWLDFVGSVFVHAAGYGVVGEPLSRAQQAWKAGWIVHQFGTVWPLTMVFVAALAGAAQRLWLLLALAMAAVPVLARLFFAPHLIPAWLLMAIAGGVWLAGLVAAPTPRRWAAPVAVALAVVLVMDVDSWYSNGDADKRRAGQQHVLDDSSRVADARGSFGYVLGIRPEFYFFNGIVPATDVLYPQALAGAGRAPPSDSSASRMRRLHAQVQAHAEQRLAEQFAATPPRHVFVVDRWAGSGGRHTAVATLDAYLKDHCEPVRHVDGKPYQSGWLFTCRTGDAAGRPADKGG